MARSLIALLADGPPDDAGSLTASLQACDPELAHAKVALDPSVQSSGTQFGLAEWNDHSIRIEAYATPVEPAAIANCVDAANYHHLYKRQARAHRSHIRLRHVGGTTDPLDQYTALTAVAASLASFGMIMVLNEHAKVSFPAESLVRKAQTVDDSERRMLQKIRDLPLLWLFCGLGKYRRRV
jgi:hypothetical protein